MRVVERKAMPCHTLGPDLDVCALDRSPTPWASPPQNLWIKALSKLCTLVSVVLQHSKQSLNQVQSQRARCWTQGWGQQRNCFASSVSSTLSTPSTTRPTECTNLGHAPAVSFNRSLLTLIVTDKFQWVRLDKHCQVSTCFKKIFCDILSDCVSKSL